MDKIILIGGAPTVGKSYVADKIARELNLPWISTDTIREQMRKVLKKKDYPNLFYYANATAKMAEEHLGKTSAKQIVKNCNAESVDVWNGVMSLMGEVSGSLIIEGVAILPRLVKGLKIKNKQFKTIFLVDENVERIRNVVFTRGLWDDADKYPDGVKEKEVAWVLAFNEYIIKEAGKYRLPIVEVGDRKKYLKQIKALIK